MSDNKTENRRRAMLLERSLPAVLAIALCTLPSQFTAAGDGDFSMPVQNAFVITGRGTVVMGRIESGAVSAGDTVCVPVLDGGLQPFTVTSIERYRKLIERAETGDMVGLQLAEELASKRVEKGERVTGEC